MLPSVKFAEDKVLKDQCDINVPAYYLPWTDFFSTRFFVVSRIYNKKLLVTLRYFVTAFFPK